ncbi:MAG TPA: hypothetical protein PKK78_12670 [Kouleothrix sp.]|nr:hypothetical protein [Kouleothrix sp.]
MNEASAWRIELARSIAGVYAQHPQICMAALGGSAARGLADAYSDMDIAIYWHTLDHDWLAAPPLQAVGGRRFTFRTLFEGQIVVEQYTLGAVKFDVAHFALSWLDQSVAAVLEQGSLDDEKQEVLDGFLTAIPFYGIHEYEAWRTRIAAYPNTLGEAMVRRHLVFYPQWVLEQHGLARGDLLSFYSTLCDMMRNLLGVLAGLNHLYMSMEKPKRSADLLRRMPIQPANVAERFDALLAGDRAAAPAALATLIDETIGLVEQHMPNVDTSRARQMQQFVVQAVEYAPPLANTPTRPPVPTTSTK